MTHCWRLSEVAKGVGGFEEVCRSGEVTQRQKTEHMKVPGIAGDRGSGDPQHLWTRGGSYQDWPVISRG